MHEVLSRDHKFVGTVVKVGNSTKLAKVVGVYMLGAYFKRMLIKWVDSGRTQIVSRRSIKPVEDK